MFYRKSDLPNFETFYSKPNKNIDPQFDPNYNDATKIGIINFNDDILNEDRVGNINDKQLSDYSVWVYGSEGTIPHFHLYNSSNDLVCCICLLEPKYFDHGYSFEKLNSRERKILDKWLRDKDPNYKVSRWNVACNIWNNAIRNIQFKVPSQQPNYRDMYETTKD